MGFVGASILHDSLSYPDPTNKVQGTAWGFKTVWELDAHPTDQTMFYTYASYNTAFDTAHIDMRPGYLFFNNVAITNTLSVGKVYLGPQGVFSSDIHDRIWKAGAHLTLDEIGPMQVTLASGYVHDRYLGPGAYFMLRYVGAVLTAPTLLLKPREPAGRPPALRWVPPRRRRKTIEFHRGAP